MTALTVRCPLPRCGTENAFDAESCDGCGMPVRGYARLSTYADHLFNQGLAAAGERRYAAARDYFAAVVYWQPADTQARNALALAAFELGDADEARRQWQEVLDRNPNDPLAGRGLSRLVTEPG